MFNVGSGGFQFGRLQGFRVRGVGATGFVGLQVGHHAGTRETSFHVWSLLSCNLSRSRCLWELKQA